MWGSFVLATMFALILLYLPGYLLGRVYFSSSANSLAFAPVLTIALLVLLGVTAFPLSVSWFALPALALLASVIIFLIFRKPLAQGARGSWSGFGAYVLMGALTTVAVFLANIDGATSFSVQTDTTFHLQCAQAMLQSGHYSVLSASVYPDVIANGGCSYSSVKGDSPFRWAFLAMLTQALPDLRSLPAVRPRTEPCPS